MIPNTYHFPCRGNNFLDEKDPICTTEINKIEQNLSSRSKPSNTNETIETSKASVSEVKIKNTLDETTALNDLCGISNSRIVDLTTSHTPALIDSLHPNCSNLTVEATEQELRYCVLDDILLQFYDRKI